MTWRLEFNLTTVMAVRGALLSSSTFGWNLLRDLSDRARLKLSVRVRRIVLGGDGRWFAAAPDMEVHPATEMLYVVLSVVNVGRRPVQRAVSDCKNSMCGIGSPGKVWIHFL
jgi:hypothetical protein